MVENNEYNIFTKAELIEMLNGNLTKKDLKMTEVGYNPAVDFPEREEHWKAKIQKQKMFNLTKGKGIKSIGVKNNDK